MITQKILKDYLHYNEENGVFTRTKSIKGKGGSLGRHPGYMRQDGYIRIMIMRKLYYAHRLAWLYVYGVFPDKEIDHINGIKNDNRLSNLRMASKSQNQYNRGKAKTNTSGFKGVIWAKKRAIWIAQIKINGKSKYIGSFNSPEEAHTAYCFVANAEHGKFHNYG